MEITIVSHSLVKFLMTVLRNKDTDIRDFRKTIESLSTLLFIESSRFLPSNDVEIETPLEKTTGTIFDKKIILVPVMRAGLAMVQPIVKIFTDAITMHIGAKRNEETLETISYYSSLDEQLNDNIAYILDPMLATGNTITYTLMELAKFTPSEIRLLTIISSPEGLEKVSAVADKIKIPVNLWTTVIDRELNENGYILPGLGDAGDRFFGTL